MLSDPRTEQALPTPVAAASRLGGHRLVFANHLRGLAALSVVIGHMIAVYWGAREIVAAYTATPLQQGPPSNLYPLIVRPWLNLGPLGVATFFLISGLVVPISLDHHSRATFLVARAFRIFPTFVVGALMCLGVVWLNARFWALPFPPGFDRTVVSSTLLLVQDFTGAADFTLVAWTLCIELKFYLLVAVFAPAIRRGNMSLVFAVAFAALAVNVAWTSALLQPWIEDWPQIGQIGLESACVVFMFIGVLFNYHLRGLIGTYAFTAGILGLTAIFAVCSSIGPLAAEFPVTPANYGYALSAFSLLYAARRWIRPFKPLDALAAVSFPLYVVHSLIGYSTLKFLILHVGLAYRPALALSLATVLACAAALHATVERWSIGMGKRLATRARPLARPVPAPLPRSQGA